MTVGRHWLIFAAVLLGLIGLAPRAAAQATTAEAIYWTLVADTIDALETEKPDAELLDSLAIEWEAISALQLDDGRIQPIDTVSISSRLRDPAANWSELRAELLALQTQQSAWQQGKRENSEAKATLAEILSGNAFNYAEEELNFVERLWARFVTFILDLLARILGGTGRFGLTLANLVTVLLVLILIVVLGLIVRSVLRDFVSEAELAQTLEREKVLTADSALTQAQSHSEDGDYRTAVRYLYLSCLLSLEERGLLRYDRSLTNREYLRSVAHVPEIAAVLRDVVNIFDRVWYGYQPINAETYNRYAAQVQALRRRG